MDTHARSSLVRVSWLERAPIRQVKMLTMNISIVHVFAMRSQLMTRDMKKPWFHRSPYSKDRKVMDQTFAFITPISYQNFCVCSSVVILKYSITLGSMSKLYQIE